jgi:hypothetical protein
MIPLQGRFREPRALNGQELEASIAPWSNWSVRSVFWHCRLALGIILFWAFLLAALLAEFSAFPVAVTLSISKALISMSL